MKLRSLLLGAALASGTAAGSLVLAQEMMPAPAPMPGVAAETTQQTMTEAYANAAAIGDMYEIEAANLAWERSKNEDIKAFAKMLIADHTATTAKLKVLVDQNQGSLPDALDENHEGMMDQLEAAEEAQFDQMWVAQQITAHEQALKLHEDYAANGDQEPFKAFAADTAKKVKMHLKEAKALGGSAG